MINETTQPQYQAGLTVFAATSSSGATSALQEDEFAQRRINSYVGVINSELFARAIIIDTGIDIDPPTLTTMIAATVEADTVLMQVTVTDTDPDRAQRIAASIARNLDTVIGEVDNREDKSEVELRVISGPTLNPKPVSPRKALNLALGGALGLALGIAIGLAMQQFDTSFRSRDALAAATGVPTLAAMVRDARAHKDPVLNPADNRTRRAEGYRQLRTNLRFVNATNPIQVLVVTSAVESEGKTSTAINLAQTFAKADVKTLLVDADLRRPKLERRLDLEDAVGLTTVLVGDANWVDLLQDWGPDGLAILASGPIPPNPSELLSSQAMGRFIAEARELYDVIIIDTPPVLPVTDGVVTSVLADGVLMVVRYGSTKQDQVFTALESLRSVSAKVLGTVMTMVPAQHGPAVSSYYGQQDVPREA
ncbi:polysaccharide biosynthesis tyrosine autokinase [Micropruina sp.]|uniref:polysaccharide biosynthesis tyrosine autokinase n=1 Tax=Micropruina sp. TaxID=2737536 RepID=UPI0039E47AC1